MPTLRCRLLMIGTLSWIISELISQGDAAVGKTSIVHQFVDQTFPKLYAMVSLITH